MELSRNQGSSARPGFVCLRDIDPEADLLARGTKVA